MAKSKENSGKCQWTARESAFEVGTREIGQNFGHANCSEGVGKFEKVVLENVFFCANAHIAVAWLNGSGSEAEKSNRVALVASWITTRIFFFPDSCRMHLLQLPGASATTMLSLLSGIFGGRSLKWAKRGGKSSGKFGG